MNQLFGSFGILTGQYSQHKDRFETKPQDLTAIRVTDATISPNPVSGGFGQVFGPTINNKSDRDIYAGSFTGYIGTNEFKLGGDYSKDNTSGATYYTGGQQIFIRPCGTGVNTCDLARAPLYTNSAGKTVPVYYEHRICTANATDLTPSSGAVADQALGRLPPGTAAHHAHPDGQRRHPVDQSTTSRATGHRLRSSTSGHPGLDCWDFVGDGTSKLSLYGKFFFAIPTGLERPRSRPTPRSATTTTARRRKTVTRRRTA